MLLETWIKFCMIELDFLEKKIFAPETEKMDQKRAKNRVFWIY